MKVRLTLTVFLTSILCSLPAISQQIKPEDKQKFKDSIHRIKVWTRIANDTALGYYIVAINTAKTQFNRKGYRVEQVFYDSRKKLSYQAWEKQVIGNLAPDEAFLDLVTRIAPDTSGGKNQPGRVVKHIVDAGGPVLVNYNMPVNTGEETTGYLSVASANLYVPWIRDNTGSCIPLFSKKEEIASGDISLAVKNCLSMIPRSANPVEIPENERVAPVEKTRLEIAAFGGYVFPSSMDIISASTGARGTVDFSAGGHYGIDISVALSRSMDVMVMYDREDTKFTMNTPETLPDDVIAASVNYILVGAVKNFRISRVVSPYVCLALGSVNMTPKDDYYRNVWYFAVSPQAGIKFYLSKLIGLRFHASCMYQVHPQKAPFLYTDYGYSNAWDAWSNMLQVGLSAGIIFRIGTSR
jgi:hypothetical protein